MAELFFFSSRRRHTRYWRDWSSDVCSSDLGRDAEAERQPQAHVALEALHVHELEAGSVGHAKRFSSSPRPVIAIRTVSPLRSGERRGGEEGRFRGAPYHYKKKKSPAKSSTS